MHTRSDRGGVARFTRGEVERAVAHWWQVGNVLEDWSAWTNLFVPDVFYVDYFWGPLHGRREVDLWIHSVMKGVPEIYTVLDWFTIDDDVVVFHCQNRRDNPAGDGPPFWDFPGFQSCGTPVTGCSPRRRITGTVRGRDARARSTSQRARGRASPTPSSE
jgi:hypothetical protein